MGVLVHVKDKGIMKKTKIKIDKPDEVFYKCKKCGHLVLNINLYKEFEAEIIDIIDKS